MTSAPKKGASRARSTARRPSSAPPAPVAVEDASPSLLAKLATEVKVIAAWIGVIAVGVGVVWTGLDKVGEWRSASDAAAAKLLSVERQMTEVSAGLALMKDGQGTLLPRVVALERVRAEVQILQQRIQTAETQIATAGSTRNQQIEGLRDRVRVMESTDQSQLERTAEQSRVLGTIVARMDDMLRRMEGMERRLDRSLFLPPPAQRNGADPESPAVWLLPHLGT